MNIRIALSLTTIVGLTLHSHGALIAVDGGYVATAATNPAYEDTGGTELTDGNVGSTVWPNPAVDFDPLVGWQNIDPSATFSFSSAKEIDRIVFWTADSDGSAGVAVPNEVRVTAPGFDETFSITNPPGRGTTVPIELGGLDLTADNVTLTFDGNNLNWIMIAEVQFFDNVTVPEPSTGLLAALAAITLAMRRRRV